MPSASQQANQLFANYTKIDPVVPEGVWIALRILTLLITLGLAALLTLQPKFGLRLWWSFAIPVVPALLVVAPGLWRQICPMAFLNQIPRRFGFSRERTLPDFWRDRAFAIAVAIFFIVVGLRYPLLNANGPLVALAIVAVLVAAFVGGLVFKGRSGWCGTFCPLGPIQRDYGQAPLIMVRNGYCKPCLGCQKSCYDFNPRAAIFSDMEDDDQRYAAQRRYFMGMMPGMILGYFLGLQWDVAEPMNFLMMLGGACGSVGLYQLTTGFFGVSPLRAANIFGGLALIAFYYFALPIIVKTLLMAPHLDGQAPPLPLSYNALGYGFGALLATAMLYRGRKNEEVYESVAQSADQIRVDPTGRKLSERLEGALVTDQETGSAFPALEEDTLLDAIEKARLKINFGCRSGMCGADAVAICDGKEHLSPPGPDELATLRRMGLDGVARLACVCKVTGAGAVTINRDVHKFIKENPPASSEPRIDRLAEQNIARVVIIGNGVAGMGVADALRRSSDAVSIEVITDEPHRFYNRMAIGRVIYGRAAMDGLFLLPDDWCEKNRVELWRNTRVAAIDRDAREVRLATGEALPYDRLVLATGAEAAPPSADYARYANAFVLRKADDATAIRAYAQTEHVRRAVVIGGGVLGVEAADALRHLGLRVTLLQRARRIMDRQLDELNAQRLTSFLANMGIETRAGVSVASYEGAERLEAVTLSDGTRIEAELFVACAGLAPRVELARAAGLDVGRGVRVDASLRSSDPFIYAVGDVAELPEAPGGLWPIASAQAEAAVADMQMRAKPYETPRLIVQLKCDGADVKSYGEIDAAPGDEVIVSPPDEGATWRFILREGALVGGALVGPPGSGRDFAALVDVSGPLPPEWLDALRAGRLSAPRARAAE